MFTFHGQNVSPEKTLKDFNRPDHAVNGFGGNCPDCADGEVLFLRFGETIIAPRVFPINGVGLSCPPRGACFK